METTDEEILHYYEQGAEEKAFKLIINKYSQRLYKHIRSIVGSHEITDDILQNTFIKAWRAFPNFKLDAKIYTWLYTISTNESLSYLRQTRNRNTVSIENYDAASNIPARESEYVNNTDDISIKLDKAVDMLPEKQKMVFKMKYFQHMKYEEISEALDTSIGALKASYHFAVNKIKNYLDVC